MKEKLSQVQAQLAKSVMENQRLRRDYKEVRFLLDRAMKFAKQVKVINNDYETLKERERNGLRG